MKKRILALVCCFSLTFGLFTYQPPKAEAVVASASLVSSVFYSWMNACGVDFFSKNIDTTTLADALNPYYQKFLKTVSGANDDILSWLGYESISDLAADLTISDGKLFIPKAVAVKLSSFTDWFVEYTGIKSVVDSGSTGSTYRPAYIVGAGMDGDIIFSDYQFEGCSDAVSNFAISCGDSSFSFQNVGLSDNDRLFHYVLFCTDEITIDQAGYYMVDYDYSFSAAQDYEYHRGFAQGFGCLYLNSPPSCMSELSSIAWPVQLLYNKDGAINGPFNSLNLYDSSRAVKYNSCNMGDFWQGDTGTSAECFFPAGSIVKVRFGLSFTAYNMMGSAAWRFALRLSDNEYNTAVSSAPSFSVSVPGALTLPDVSSVGDADTVPLTVGINAADLDELADLIAEKLVANELSTSVDLSGVEEGVGAVDGKLSQILQAIKDGFLSLPQTITNAVTGALSALFAPDQALVTTMTDGFNSKFAFLPTLKQVGVDLFGMTAETDPPVIWIHLEDAEGQYTYGGPTKALDLSWYQRYKADVDRIISGFLWLGFLWLLFKRASAIINGGEMISEYSRDLAQGHRDRRKK